MLSGPARYAAALDEEVFYLLENGLFVEFVLRRQRARQLFEKVALFADRVARGILTST